MERDQGSVRVREVELDLREVCERTVHQHARRALPRKEKPRRLNQVAGVWRRPIDSQTPVCSPATLAGLTIYPTASRHVVFSARVGVVQKQKTQHVCTCRVFNSGDVLLSHGLSPYYHRGCSVSLPCSEWERVVPLRYCHQSAEPHWRFAAVAATQARSRVSGDSGD